MNVYHIFPYANFHEINIDWLLQKLKGLEEWAAQFDPDLIHDEIQSVINQMIADGDFDVFFAQWIQPLQTAIEDLTPRVEALESAVGDLSGTVSGHTTAISNLSDTVTNNYTELSGDITVINNTTIPGIQSDVLNISSELTALSNDYSAFKPVVTDELADHETRITALENAEPPIPAWQNRNYTYRGQRFDTLAELLAAVEAGLTYIGDIWRGVIPHPDPAITNFTVSVIVAFHRSNSSAYLIIYPATSTEKRKIINYSDSDPDGIHAIIDSIVQRNYTTFNSKLSTFNITSKSAAVTVWGSLLSATQYFGYPAFDPADDLNLNINGKLPFVQQYLSSATNIMLLDDNATDTYAYINSGYASVGGMLSYSTVNTADMGYPFMVKYN